MPFDVQTHPLNSAVHVHDYQLFPYKPDCPLCERMLVDMYSDLGWSGDPQPTQHVWDRGDSIARELWLCA